MSRLQNSPVVLPFLDDARFIDKKVMTGITGSIYTSLHDVVINELEELLELNNKGCSNETIIPKSYTYIKVKYIVPIFKINIVKYTIFIILVFIFFTAN